MIEREIFELLKVIAVMVGLILVVGRVCLGIENCEKIKNDQS